MPLLDHFKPPLSQRRRWESFHSAWAEAIAQQLNQDLLPPHYFAEANIKVGTHIATDVGTFEESDDGQAPPPEGSVAVWAPPRPTATAPLSFNRPDVFEVQVLNDEEGPQVVAAIELVSPANKDRPSNRHMFGVKCASYLQQSIAVVVVNVVTERSGNSHRGVLDVLEVTAATPGQSPTDLYAVAYRAVADGEALSLEMWVELLTLGAPLPTVPLWIGAERCVPLHLEETYAAACAARRI
jgi:Protein of unknown function (DUF4058)